MTYEAQTALKGWSLPQSPGGRSSLVPPPPWNFSGEVVSVEFTADPAKTAALLPEWLTPEGDGSCAFVFCDWCSSSDTDPRFAEDPARSQYKEAYLLVNAGYEGSRVGRIPYIWVDSDASLLRGLIQGFPKKFGTVSMSKAVEVGRGGPRKDVGGRFSAHISSVGRRLATASVTIERRCEDGVYPRGVTRPLMHTRLLPSLSGDEPTVYERTRGHVSDMAVGTTYEGMATLEFGAAEHEELADLCPIEVGKGWVSAIGFTVSGGTEESLLAREQFASSEIADLVERVV